MKKILIATSLCAGVLLGASTIHAAPVLNNTDIATDGSVTFKIKENPDEEGEIHTPDEEGEDPEIIELPGEGSHGKGNLRIQFVPHFKFVDVNEITAKQTTSNVKVLSYNIAGSASDKKAIAPFVQVTDERGLVGNNAKWTLQVTATPFTAKDASIPGGSDILENCQILLNDSTLTQDYGTSLEAADLVTGQGASSVIGTDSTSAATTVLATKTAQSTNGKQISNVFHKDYKKDQTTYVDEQTTGVQFVKPAGKAPISNVEYKSTLKWSLVTGP